MAAAIALLHDDGRSSLTRWSLAAAVVLAAHVGLVADYRLIDWPQPAAAPDAPAIMVELAPLPVAPLSQSDAAPGPEAMHVPEATAAVTPRETEPERIEPLPRVETPAVVTLPDPKPVERAVEPKPVQEKPQERVRRERRPAAAPTSPAPRSERPPAPVARAPSSGSSSSSAAAVSPSWVAQVTAHINRYKRYPSDARGASGAVTVAFTVDRNGRILSRRVSRSSGAPALDAEALAALARAQPLPPFPASMTGASVSVAAPFQFVAR